MERLAGNYVHLGFDVYVCVCYMETISIERQRGTFYRRVDNMCVCVCVCVCVFEHTCPLHMCVSLSLCVCVCVETDGSSYFPEPGAGPAPQAPAGSLGTVLGF